MIECIYTIAFVLSSVFFSSVLVCTHRCQCVMCCWCTPLLVDDECPVEFRIRHEEWNMHACHKWGDGRRVRGVFLSLAWPAEGDYFVEGHVRDERKRGREEETEMEARTGRGFYVVIGCCGEGMYEVANGPWESEVRAPCPSSFQPRPFCAPPASQCS